MEKKKVLFLDDEQDFLRMATSMFELSGKYEVLALSDVKDIISRIKGFKPDIILLDLLMPSLGGIEICQMLNDDPLTRSIPIIIISALDKDIDKLKAYKQGVVDYIVKPVRVEELMSKIEYILPSP